MKKQKTKQLLLEKGAELMQIKGYHSTGIQEIVNACKVPKGSFYFYFESKEYFGLELINYLADLHLDRIDEHLNNHSYTPEERLENYFSSFFENLKNNNFKGGSFLGNFIQELADVNEMFRQGLVIVSEQVIDRFAKTISEIYKESNPAAIRKKAENMYFNFEGTIMRVKLHKSLEPYKSSISS